MSRRPDASNCSLPQLHRITIAYNRIHLGDALFVRADDRAAGFLLQEADSANMVGVVVRYEDMSQSQTLVLQCVKHRFCIAGVHHETLTRRILGQMDVIIPERGQDRDVLCILHPAPYSLKTSIRQSNPSLKTRPLLLDGV
jgi:hypothetical protein